MRSQSCVRYHRRRGVEASLWATAIIRAALTVMVTLLHSPGRAIAPSVTGRGSKATSKQPCRIQTLAIRTTKRMRTAEITLILSRKRIGLRPRNRRELTDEHYAAVQQSPGPHDRCVVSPDR